MLFKSELLTWVKIINVFHFYSGNCEIFDQILRACRTRSKERRASSKICKQDWNRVRDVSVNYLLNFIKHPHYNAIFFLASKSDENDER